MQTENAAENEGIVIHERYNERSCQRDHTLGSGTREATRLDTQAHSLHKSSQTKRILTGKEAASQN